MWVAGGSTFPLPAHWDVAVRHISFDLFHRPACLSIDVSLCLCISKNHYLNRIDIVLDCQKIDRWLKMQNRRCMLAWSTYMQPAKHVWVEWGIWSRPVNHCCHAVPTMTSSVRDDNWTHIRIQWVICAGVRKHHITSFVNPPASLHHWCQAGVTTIHSAGTYLQ